MCYPEILILVSKTMNITAGPSVNNKRKNVSNSLSSSKKSRSIRRKTLTGLQKKKLCEMFSTHLYQNKERVNFHHPKLLGQDWDFGAKSEN